VHHPSVVDVAAELRVMATTAGLTLEAYRTALQRAAGTVSYDVSPLDRERAAAACQQAERKIAHARRELIEARMLLVDATRPPHPRDAMPAASPTGAPR
jgi:hypothetical protein